MTQTKHPWNGGGGGGGTPIYGPIRGCAAQQSLEQGLQISVSVWNRVYFMPFRLWSTVGVTMLLPESRYKPSPSSITNQCK